jgi:UDP:flavonoid glycosyltransferase YjiC (YdhE family)
MVIAYSCAGEGFGHAARMAALVPVLSRRHTVHCFAPGEVAAYLRPRLPGIRMSWLPHFSFVKRGNRVMHLESLGRGLGLVARMPKLVAALAKRLRAIGASAVVSDFDPFLAWAGRLCGLPVVQINHPGIVQRYPACSPRALAGIAATRLMEGPFDRRVWTSFFGGDVGPILREGLRPERAERGDYILVNLAERLRPSVLPELDRLGLNYRVFPSPKGDYDQALLGCRALISTAGYQTASEALCLGKPLLLMPQDGQYEQKLNARMAIRSGGAMACRIEDFAETLPSFLASIDSLRAREDLGFRFREGTMAAAALILAGIEGRKPEGASSVPRPNGVLSY